MAERCIEIFTAAPGEVVLDPFAGSGTTLIGAYNLGRQGVGLELYDRFAGMCRERLEREALLRVEAPACEPRLHLDDARNLACYLPPESVDFILTSPPYWDILLARRSADRREQRDYGSAGADLGRLEDYRDYLRELTVVFERAVAVLKTGRYCVAVVMDLRKKDRFYALHLDLSVALQQVGLQLDDMIVWDRRHEYNRLRPLGFPSVFRVNKVHEYLLIFKKNPLP